MMSISGLRWQIVLMVMCLSAVANAQTRVLFQVEKVVLPDEHLVGIRGDHAPLSWDRSYPLNQTNDGDYEVQITFDAQIKDLEFKFVTYSTDGQVNWETNNNRGLVLEGKPVTSSHRWDVEPYVDPSMLEPIASKELLEDYELLERVVLDVHPGTYRYADTMQIKNSLTELKETFQKPLTHGDAYLAINKVLTTIRCGHTFASLYNQNRAINSMLHRGRDKLPFTYQWIEGQMVVMYDATSDQIIPEKAIVVDINDTPVEEVIDTMLPYISTDGDTPASKLSRLEIFGFDFQYDAFDALYPLLFPIGERLSLTLRLPDGSLQTVTTNYTTRFDRIDLLSARYETYPQTNNDMWDFEILDESSAMLTINSFSLMGWKRLTMDYKAFLNKAFTELREKGIRHLILDARLNNGGNDEMLNELLTYFDVDRIKIDDTEGRTRYSVFPDQIKPHIKTWGEGEPWFYHLDKEKGADGYYHFPEDGKVNYRNKKKRNYFQGEMFLLTSSHNASLAYYMTRSFRALGLGTIVGQETGGNLRGVNGGQIVFLTLPNSTITIDFPVMGMFSINEQSNQGITPDHPIEQTYEDYLKGVDTQRQYILDDLRLKLENR